jgi:large subunit ribosomal protein L14e
MGIADSLMKKLGVIHIVLVESQARLGQIVHVLRGREAGTRQIIIGLEEPNYVWLADGHGRKFAHPKKKNIKHIQITHVIAQEVASALIQFGYTSDAMLRYALNNLHRTRF